MAAVGGRYTGPREAVATKRSRGLGSNGTENRLKHRLSAAAREGQEDQLGALGLVVNILVLWKHGLHGCGSGATSNRRLCSET